MINTVKIGVITHKIKVIHNLYGTQEDGKTCWLSGRIKHDLALIELDDENDPQSQLVVLWHEILHGILTQAGQTEQPENLLNALSFGLVQAVRNNPALIALTLSEGESNGQ